jgi:uncharacterized protein (TIGR02265 family)
MQAARRIERATARALRYDRRAMTIGEFVDPPWDAPVDEAAVVRAIPTASMVKGIFLQPILEIAQKNGFDLGLPRDRYIAFHDYPAREHAHALYAAASRLYPDVPIRKGLRRLGHPVVPAFETSTIGRVVWATATDVEGALHALSKGYALSCSHARLSVLEFQRGRARLRFTETPWFLDSHHVGVVEGTFGWAKVKATIRVRLETPSTGEFLCEW